MFPSQESLILGCELYLSACGVTIQEAWYSAVNLSFLFTVGTTPRDALPRWEYELKPRVFLVLVRWESLPTATLTSIKYGAGEIKKDFCQGRTWLSSVFVSSEELRLDTGLYRFLRWCRKCCCLSIFRCEFGIFCIGFSKGMYILVSQKFWIETHTEIIHGVST